MIYGFTQQSGGQARIYSEVGQGTVVGLYLPRHVGDSETDEAVAEPDQAPRAKAGATVLIVEEPRASDAERVEVRQIAEGVTRVILRYGFMESPNIPNRLKEAVERGHVSGIDLDAMTYYIGRETVLPSHLIEGMAVWRETLFSLMQRNAERTAAYFCVPPAQVFEIGFEVEI